MKFLYALGVGCTFVLSAHAELQDREMGQVILQSKEHIKWECAKLVYMIVKNSLEKVSLRPLYSTLYQHVSWVFSSAYMQEVLAITNPFASKAELYALAACVAQQEGDSDTMLILQIACEYEKEPFALKYRGTIMYGVGLLCGYIAAYYWPHEKILR